MSIKYSFVLPTYNRLSLLKETLQSLLDQDFDRDIYEIIIVDDNSKDTTESYITKLVKTNTYPIIYHRNKKNEGVGYNRNYGIKLAHWDYIIQVEDDAKYPTNYLREIDQRIKKNTEISRWTLIILPRKTRNFDEGIVPKLVEFRREAITNLTKVGKRSIIWWWIFKKDLVKKVWGYKSLKIGEDTELVKRINQAGYRSFALYSTFWWHYEPSCFSQFFKRMYRQWVSYKEYKEEFDPPIHFIHKLFWTGLLTLPFITLLGLPLIWWYSLLLPLAILLIINIMNNEIRRMYSLMFKSKYSYLIPCIVIYHTLELYGILTWRITRSLKEKQNFIY